MYKIWLLILLVIRGTASGFKEGLKLCRGSEDVFPVVSPYDIINRI